MRKRILSILGIMCMVLAGIPMNITSVSAGSTAVEYLYPVYKTTGDASNGIKEWKNDGSCTAYTSVEDSDDARTWGTTGNGSWYVVDSNVEIKGRITCTGNVKLILTDGYTLTASKGITVTGSNSLTIYGQSNGTGQLVANGSSEESGIGGISSGEGSNIVINGGTVKATGGGAYNKGSAGIGGGNGGKASNITVNGGEVTATGGGGNYSGGAGIGGGGNYSTKTGNGKEGNNITINGGKVTATGGGTYYDGGAGIGGGNGGTGSAITINSGTVKATGTSCGAGIGGGGNHGTGSAITINGGTVTAKGNGNYYKGGAGIGGGAGGIGSDITINDGDVDAMSGGSGGAGIGGGNARGNGSNITINGGDVDATGDSYGAGIGGGSGGNGSEITISGGTVKAMSGSYGTSIGGSNGGSGSNIYASENLAVEISTDNTSWQGVAHADNTTDIASSINGYCYLYAAKAVAGIIADESTTKYSSIQRAVDAATDGQIVQMIDDSTENVSIASGKNITLDLNGYAITPASTTAETITVNGKLTLTDTSAVKHYFTEDASGLWVWDKNETTTDAHSVTGGMLTGSTSKAAVKVEGGTFVMNGGNIVGNNIGTNTGAGVYMSSGSFEMKGGLIAGNAAGYGGGVGACGGSFSMMGGKISNNVANGDWGAGGGVLVKESGSLAMTGGEISGNTAKANGGGVFYENGNITLGGTAVITDNTKTDKTTANNLYLKTDKTVTIGTKTGGSDGNGVPVPAEGMEIGVITETAPAAGSSVAITGENGSDYSKYFTSDNTVYKVKFAEAITSPAAAAHLELVNYDISTIASKTVKINLEKEEMTKTQAIDIATAQKPKDNISKETVIAFAKAEDFETSNKYKVITAKQGTDWAAGTDMTLADLKAALSGDNSKDVFVIGDVVNHNHSFTYADNADAKTITATCGVELCYLTDKKVVATLSAADAEYTGSAYNGASIEGKDAWNNAGAANLTLKYKGRDGTTYGESATAPENAGKYTVTMTAEGTDKTVSADFEIKSKQLTVTGTEVNDKTYDGNTTASIKTNGTLTGAVEGDTVSINTASGTFADKNVGTDKPVTVSYILTGSDAGNYTVKDSTYAKAAITAKQLTVTGTKASDKTYDGNTAATIETNGTLTGAVEGDTVSINTASGTFADKSVGTDKSVAVSYTLTGADAGNYTVKDSTYVKAAITAKQLTVTGTEVSDKTYDGSTAASIKTSGTLTGAVAGDTVSIDTASGTFADKKVGTGKSVTVSYILTGADAGNYTVKDSTYATAAITPKQLTVTGTEVKASKEYDGTTDAEVTADGTLEGAVGGDDVSFDKVTASYDNKTIATGKTVTVVYTITGDDKDNYTAPVDGSKTADITQKQLTVKGTTVDNKAYDGTTDATATIGTVEGVVNGEDVSVAVDSASFKDESAGENKEVVVAYKITGNDTANYIKPQAQTINAAITKAGVSLTAVSATEITYEQALSSSTITGTAKFKDTDVTGEWSWKEGETKPAVSDSQSTEYAVIFTPEETQYPNLGATETSVKLTVNKAKVDVPAATPDLIYDGTEQTGVKLPAGETRYTLENNTGTNAKTDYSATAKLADKDNYEWNISTPSTEDQTISWSIDKRTVTLTSASDSKMYDGTALTNDKVTVGGDGWAEGEGATYDVTGIQTEVGSSKNTFTYTLWNGQTSVRNLTQDGNYEISTTEGTLTVTEMVVPISGGEDNVSFEATIDGNNAKIETISEKELEKVEAGENVTIDLSEVESQGKTLEISEVTLTTETVDNIKESTASGIEIKLSTATVVIDQDTLNAVSDQATGSEIKLVVDKDEEAEKTLTEVQKETIKDMNEPVVLDAYFVSNGIRISDFRGGTAKVLVEYPTDKPIRAWFVADNGDKEEVKSEFDKEKQIATFEAEHFSHYVMEQSEIDISKCQLILSSKKYAFANKTRRPAVAVQDDTVLTEGVDYTVENPGGKKVGTYAVTVTGIGDYTGTLSDTYIINPPAKSIKTVKAGKKKLTVKWKKSKKAYTAARTGFQIRYSTSKSFKKYKTRKVGKKAVSKTIKSLKSHKKYYVKMRAYKKVKTSAGTRTYYSKWSKAKVRKTK